MPWCVEKVLVERAEALVRISWSIDLTVRGLLIDSGFGFLAGLAVDDPHSDRTHRSRPTPRRNLHQLLLSAPGLEQLQLRQAEFIRNVRDPLPIRRPARQEAVVFPERQLVRLATRCRQNEQVVVLT